MRIVKNRPSQEAVLISALINTQNVEGATAWGITPEMFIGYQTEYRWLLSYRQSYDAQPSVHAFETKFPDFPLTDHIDVEWAADEVKHRHLRRDLSKVVEKAAVAISEGDLEEAVFAITGFSPPTAARRLKSSLVDFSVLDEMASPINTVSVPWKSLQESTGGMRGGDLWQIAARFGHGKSWSLAEMAVHSLMEGKKVLFYSLEMAERQVQGRVHAILAHKMGVDIKHSELHHRTVDLLAYKKLLHRIEDEVPGEFFVVDPSHGTITPGMVQAQCSEADLVIVDHVGLMHSVLGNRAIDDWRHMATISNMLKEIAVSNDIPILCAAQINREGDTANWRPPKASNLAQSDALGQDADVVLTHKRYSKSAMVYSIEKNRHGDSQVLFFTRFKANSGDFSEIPKDEADDIRDLEDE
jgi:replicative DNA helicase